jgi:hypothetical protein
MGIEITILLNYTGNKKSIIILRKKIMCLIPKSKETLVNQLHSLPDHKPTYSD